MSKLFINKFNSILKFKHSISSLAIKNSYRTTNYLKKKSVEDSNKFLILNKINDIMVSDKKLCLEQLERVLECLKCDFKKLKWLEPKFQESFCLKQLKFAGDFKDLNLSLIKYIRSNKIGELLDYITNDLSQFNVKEKAIIFRIFNIINRAQVLDRNNEILMSNQNKLKDLLMKLEIDFYDQINNCDLVDFVNYYNGLFLLRSSNLYFFSKTTDKIYEEIKNIYSKAINLKQEDTNDVELVERINKIWENDLKTDKKNIFKIHEKLMMLTNYGRVNLFRILIKNNYEFLNNVQVDILSYILDFFYPIRLVSSNEKEFYFQLINNNIKRMIENIDQINNFQALSIIINFFLNSNQEDEIMIKYRNSLIEYFLERIKYSKNIPELTKNMKCLSDLLSKRDRNINNTFLRLYDPLFNKFSNDIFINSNDMVSNQNNDIQNQKILNVNLSRSKKEIISNKIDSFGDNINLFSIRYLIESNKNIKVHNLTKDLGDRFVIDYSKNLNQMSEEIKYKYFLNASEIIQLVRDLRLNKRILDSILNEHVLDKDYKLSELSAAIGLMLNNPEYSFDKFEMLSSYIEKIIDNDITSILPILDPLTQNFYFDLIPDKISKFFNNIRDELLINLLDKDVFLLKTNDLLAYNEIVGKLYLARNKIKYVSNKKINTDYLKKNFEKCLNDFNKQTLLNENMNERESDLSDVVFTELKNFEYKLFCYSLCFRLISKLLMLSNEYNHEVLSDILDFNIRILSIFSDNLFSNVVFNHSNKKKNFNTNLIFDILTVYGLFSYFDKAHLKCNNTPDDPNSSRIEDNLKKLKAYNRDIYKLLKDNSKMESIKLAQYNFDLINMGIEFNEPVNDLFEQIQSFDDIKNKFAHLNLGRLKFFTKLIFYINQNLCVKHKDSNLIWLFKNIKPELSVDSSSQNIISTLNLLLENNLVLRNPVYDYNFTANFEISIDENNKFVDPKNRNSKYRIPIFIVNDSFYYDNLNEFIKPLAVYINNFKKLYPVVTINSSKFEEIKSTNEKVDYIRNRMIVGLEEFAKK